MNEYRVNQIYLDLIYHQTPHDEMIRRSNAAYLIQTLHIRYPSLWDTTLFKTGNLLVSLGERLRRNRGRLRLSEGCQ